MIANVLGSFKISLNVQFNAFTIMFKKLLTIIRKWNDTPEQYARRIGVKLGTGCYITTKNWSTEPYLIEIGDNCRIAGETAFITHGGVWSLRKMYNDPNLDHFGRIRVGNNTYIGERCMIMPGVTIGENCIVGGCSVVTKSVPDGCMVAGNPAKFIGYTEDFYHRLKEQHDTGTGRMTSAEKKHFLLTMDDRLFEKKTFVKLP